jgi:peptide deformylase
MGLAAIQLGISKRYFVIAHEQEDKTFNRYIIINPKIISNSEELVYAGGGEGCQSVKREVEGIVPRYARITIEYQDIEGNTQRLRAREELSIAVQHEIDHLNGILFVDKIDKDDPFKDEEKMRMI